MFGNKNLRWIVLPIAVGLSATAFAASGLAWNGSELTMRPPAGAKTLTAEFRFHNTGSTATRVVSVTSSCGCLSATADKVSYAPGESGVIRAEFSLAGRQGRQVRTIAVTTDESPDNPKLLRLVVDMLEIIVVRRRFVSWRVGDEVSEKDIDVVVADPGKAVLREVQCTDPTFRARLVRGEKAGEYQVKITPASTAGIEKAIIRLNATIEGQSHLFALYAAVK